jgi:hypothetical protein
MQNRAVPIPTLGVFVGFMDGYALRENNAQLCRKIAREASSATVTDTPRA